MSDLAELETIKVRDAKRCYSSRDRCAAIAKDCRTLIRLLDQMTQDQDEYKQGALALHDKIAARIKERDELLAALTRIHAITLRQPGPNAEANMAEIAHLCGEALNPELPDGH